MLMLNMGEMSFPLLFVFQPDGIMPLTQHELHQIHSHDSPIKMASY